MQPYTAEFARANLTPQEGEVAIGKRKYRAEVGERRRLGQRKRTRLRAQLSYRARHGRGECRLFSHAHGSRPVAGAASRLRRPQESWYDMAASGVRHFPDRRDEALDWTDRMFSFNTTCFNCHVSELSTNYDLATDTYHTIWAESG